MYRTACNKQDDQLKDKPKQAAQNQPKEAQKTSQTLKLKVVGIQNLKKNKLHGRKHSVSVPVQSP